MAWREAPAVDVVRVVLDPFAESAVRGIVLFKSALHVAAPKRIERGRKEGRFDSGLTLLEQGNSNCYCSLIAELSSPAWVSESPDFSNSVSPDAVVRALLKKLTYARVIRSGLACWIIRQRHAA